MAEEGRSVNAARPPLPRRHPAADTIPAPVRKALGLRTGDLVTYTIAEGRVVMTRAETPAEDPFATFAEWDNPADRAAYAGF